MARRSGGPVPGTALAGPRPQPAAPPVRQGRMTRTVVTARVGSAVVLSDVGGQLLIGEVEFLKSPPRVAAFTAGEVGGEILDMDLVTCAVGGDLGQGQAAILDDQDGVVAVGGE